MHPMASSTVKFVALILIMICYARSSLAAEYTVGDQLGWRPLVNYYSWVRSKSIKLGDTLGLLFATLDIYLIMIMKINSLFFLFFFNWTVFNYDATTDYSVAEVTQYKFIACNASNAKFFDKSGHSIITLTEPGQHYFMAEAHCSDQMVFSVLV